MSENKKKSIINKLTVRLLFLLDDYDADGDDYYEKNKFIFFYLIYFWFENFNSDAHFYVWVPSADPFLFLFFLQRCVIKYKHMILVLVLAVPEPK